MSYASLLINWCTIESYTESLPPDAYGKPVITWPVFVDPDVPCRLMATGGVELKIGAEIVVADYKLFLGDVVITERDRVWVTVKDPTGAWIFPILYEILLVKDIQDSADGHHKECFLKTSR